MILNFDHGHYVPVLRFKRAEKVALRELGNQARAGITPLLEGSTNRRLCPEHGR